jgi:hypothetical protein
VDGVKKRDPNIHWTVSILGTTYTKDGARYRAEFSISGASFTIEYSDIQGILDWKGMLDISASGLDLSKESDRAEFLAQYTKHKKR